MITRRDLFRGGATAGLSVPLLGLFGGAVCAPAAVRVRRTAAMSQLKTDALATLDSLLTAWTPLIGSDGLWDGVSPLPDYWAAAAAPAAACALYDKAVGGSKYQARAATTIEGALSHYHQADGSFGPPGPDNSIDTMEFGKVLAVTLLLYGTAIPAATRARWTAAMLGGAEYLHTHGNLSYYTNGNINAGNFVFLRLAYLITGDRRTGYYAEKAWWTLHDPAESLAPDWSGYGFVLTPSPDPYPFDGVPASGYFTESGQGGTGLDWDYTEYALDELCLLYALAPEPRVARLINLLLNTIWPRVSQTSWRLETAGGTRNGVGQQTRTISFTTPGLAVATKLLGRTDKPAPDAQFYSTDGGFRQTYGVVAPTNSAPGLYRGSYGQLGVFATVVP